MGSLIEEDESPACSGLWFVSRTMLCSVYKPRHLPIDLNLTMELTEPGSIHLDTMFLRRGPYCTYWGMVHRDDALKLLQMTTVEELLKALEPYVVRIRITDESRHLTWHL